MTNDGYDVIVLGAGVAGLTAAHEAAQRGLRVACVERMMYGGLIVNVNDMKPGPEDAAVGADFASELMIRAADSGVTTLMEEFTSLEREGESFVIVTSESCWRARTVVVATGCRLKPLGVTGELEFAHRGVSHCADCDGPLYAGLNVVVVGGGDSALQEAHVLSQFCNRVHLIHRSGRFRARPDLVDMLYDSDNVEVHLDTVLESIYGGDVVQGVWVRGSTDRASRQIACSGVFIYVGLEPNIERLPAPLRRDETGRLTTDAHLETSWPGVFAVGAVRANGGGLLSDAMTDARQAVAVLAIRLSSGQGEASTRSSAEQ